MQSTGAEPQRGGVDDRRGDDRHGDDAESRRCGDPEQDDDPERALVLWWAGADVSDLWWGDYLQQPLALAIRRWAEGNVIGWTGTLRDLGRFAAHWPDNEPHEALSRYLVQRAAMGQQPSTLRGVISAVRMAEKLRCVPPLYG